MATQLVNVTAGVISAVYPVNSNQSIFVCPQVLGGTALLEFSQSVSGPFYQWGPGSSLAGASFRLPAPSTSGYIRVTATTQAATLAISDMVGIPSGGTLVSINAPCASQSVTTEVIIGSFRIPPYAFQSQNFNIEMSVSADFTNNANAKTLIARVNAVAGTSVYTSSALASTLNVNANIYLSGMGDGVTWKGYGAGLTSIGNGITSTAYTTLSRDYVTQETEIVVTATKGTASDAFLMQRLVAKLYY